MDRDSENRTESRTDPRSDETPPKPADTKRPLRIKSYAKTGNPEYREG